MDASESGGVVASDFAVPRVEWDRTSARVIGWEAHHDTSVVLGPRE